MWTRSHPDTYAAIYAQRTGVPIEVARTIVSWENPVLEPVDAKAVHDLRDVADRFLGFGVIPERVNIAPLVDATLFTGKSRAPAGTRKDILSFKWELMREVHKAEAILV
jgi:ABC-type nitrate/sulfonate/bicarbonate transport system substrate-binding protein